MSGINTTVYKGHSTRSASTSAAEKNKVPLSTIMENAGWSNAETFRKFYSRPVAPPKENYGQLLMENLQILTLWFRIVILQNVFLVIKSLGTLFARDYIALKSHVAH